jgi:bifunctional DNase/RNase
LEGDFKNLFGEDWRPNEFNEEAMDQPGDPSASGNGEIGGFTSETENRTPRNLAEKEVKVLNVYKHQQDGAAPQHLVSLRDNRGRRVHIYVAQPEAYSIKYAMDYAVDNDLPERPQTHDLLKIMLDRVGVQLERIIIDDLWQETFYAKMVIVKPGGEYSEIDARPSDAIALALRMHAPIYVAESVLEATNKPE